MNRKIGLIGLGYVGLPLALEFCNAGLQTIGFDVDDYKVKLLNNKKSYISYIPNKKIAEIVEQGLFVPVNDFSRLQEVEAIIITVPTPLNKNREPDLSYVVETTKIIFKYLQKGQLIVLESTTYPGTTEEKLLPILSKGGLQVGTDFFLAYSPERVDPNNKQYETKLIPKVIGGITAECLLRAHSLYSKVFDKVIPVSNTKVAEASKLLENIYRSVNIALVNELKILFDRMDIDIWEVIEAASSKPFGFTPFYPGPGLGGHCIPIDPFYLTWKAREYDFSTKFIELAGEINSSMPYWVVQKVIDALNMQGVAIRGSKILILGVAYKKDVDDSRESPAFKIIQILQSKGASVLYNDPYIPVVRGLRKYPNFISESVPLNEELLEQVDCVLIITDHTVYDYKWIYKHSPLIVDTRNVTKDYKNDTKIVKA